MKTLHKLESGDTIFIITDKYQIKEITLKYEHLLENRKDRWMIDQPYQLKSDIVKHGRVRLTKVSFHEEMDWDGCHYLKRCLSVGVIMMILTCMHISHAKMLKLF